MAQREDPRARRRRGGGREGAADRFRSPPPGHVRCRHRLGAGRRTAHNARRLAQSRVGHGALRSSRSDDDGRVPCGGACWCGGGTSCDGSGHPEPRHNRGALRPSSRDNICRIPSTGRCMAGRRTGGRRTGGRRTGIDAAGNARIISPHSAATTALPSMPPKAAVRVPDAGPGGVDFVIGGWSAVVPYLRHLVIMIEW